MQSRNQLVSVGSTRMVLVSLIAFAVLSVLPERAMAQTNTDNAYRDATFACLKRSSWHFTYAERQTGFGNDWIDTKTGKIVGSKEAGETLRNSVRQDPADPNRAFDPSTGQNFFWDSKTKTWKDAKTGESVTSTNLRDALLCCLNSWHFTYAERQTGFGNDWIDTKTGKIVGSKEAGEALRNSVRQDPADPNRAFDPLSGRNFAWDDKKQAWVDTKTGECICPKCAGQPTEKVIEKKKEACDIEFGYKYMNTPGETVKSLNGLGGSVFCNVKPWISIGGDYSALFGSTTDTIGTTKVDVSLHRQTGLFGPQFNFYPNDKVKIFVHPLFGGVHDTTKTTIGTTTTSSSSNAFAMAFGGGVDVNLGKRFALEPIKFDYVPTHFGGQWQSNYEISGGFVIRLGEKK